MLLLLLVDVVGVVVIVVAVAVVVVGFRQKASPTALHCNLELPGVSKSLK